MNIKCYKCKYFYFYVVILVVVYIFYKCDILSDISKISSFIQAICACVNVVLIYLIYKWAKKDRTLVDKHAYKMKWFMDFLLPEYASMLKNIIEKEKSELARLIDENKIRNSNAQNINKFKDEIGETVINSNYHELEAISKLYYFNNELVEIVQKETNRFHDDLIERVTLICDNNLETLKDFVPLLSEHYNKIMEMVYKNVMEQQNSDL